jgi:predicted nucleotidyltransferase
MMSKIRNDFQLSIPTGEVENFCRHWQVVEFSLFGSAIRDDFRPDSDVDVLVSFSIHAHASLFDLVQMQIELEEIFGHPVDLVEKEAIRNPYRKREILGSAQVIYAA